MYIVQFLSIIIAYCTSVIIPEMTCTKTPNNIRGTFTKLVLSVIHRIKPLPFNTFKT